MKNHSSFGVIVVILQHVLTHSIADPDDCSSFINRLPPNITISESTPSNTSLLEVNVNATAASTFIDQVDFYIIPSELSVFLLDHFKSLHVGNKWLLLLQKSIDVEYIYQEKNKYVLNNFQITFLCESNTKVMNVSVIDEDDNGPVFANTKSTNCTISGYTASSYREYTGKIETSPGGIEAADGDVTGNNITYSFLYGEPFGFEDYFIINPRYGHVNKTREVIEGDPHSFMMIIQATEMSTLGRTKIAVLEVGVHENIPVASSEVKANKAVLLVLQIISGIMIVAFTLGFAFIVHHRIKKHIVTPQVPDSSNTSKFDSMEAVTEDSFILENTIVLTETNQMNGGSIKDTKP
uniref:Uncharacterized protein LOC111119848 isoform X2 n=1 Tax=Crassostrea virginica TaxID=6565 RepID=A0A8B8CNV8_CRAVI|nr:uncharacterized protein LOC111119848 isoform X2 [Crassostrea virginica]